MTIPRFAPSVTVTIPAGCAWTASTATPWFTIVSGTSGTGPGTVSISPAANTSAPRVGSLTVAGQIVTVYQAGLASVTLYGWNGATGNSPSGLFTMNPATGAQISAIGGSGQDFSGLAFHPLTGDLFGVTSMKSVSAENLFRIDAATGVATLVGPLGKGIKDLAFDTKWNAVRLGRLQVTRGSVPDRHRDGRGGRTSGDQDC